LKQEADKIILIIMQLNNDLVSTRSIIIDASPEKVWETLTNPSLISQYLFGAQTITDWKVGSDILFKINVENTEFIDKGLVVENVPNRILLYKYWSGFCGLDDKPENYSTVLYNREVIEKNRTKLEWTQKGFADEQSRTNSQSSLDAILEQIKTIAEQ
jgi:uncharacterized protein YndB with AHSA1/START domain